MLDVSRFALALDAMTEGRDLAAVSCEHAGDEPSMIQFGRDVCGDLEAASSREWLETNGIGGFASSTITGLNTRRYHGLLTAATKPPVGRMVLLSKLEETLVLSGRRFDLSANRYPDAIYPEGYRYLKSFRLDPFPVFTYEVQDVAIEKSVFMIQGENSTVVEYRILSGAAGDCRLELRPLIAFRDYHSTTHHNQALDPAVSQAAGVASMTPYYGLPPLHLAHTADRVETSGNWYYSFEYERERERGLDYQEDLYNPLVLHFSGPRAAVIASTQPRDARDAPALRRAEIARRSTISVGSPQAGSLVPALTCAADQFVVARANNRSIIAGYHWFSDWGRDTMVALPGIALVPGHFQAAREILAQFALSVDQGMLPNRFPDAGEQPEYNTVDATLWFFDAARAYLKYSGDQEFLRAQLYSVLRDIVDWHERGTRYGIRVDTDGLLRAGVAGMQLTWMDARVGDRVVTPRHGKPVEIQALWYNALRTMQQFAEILGDDSGLQRYRQMAVRVQASFNEKFWNDAAGCLYDVVGPEVRDTSIRPNQVLAASLEYPVLAPARAAGMLEVVRRELLTPFGLRTLASSDPQYRGRCEGGVAARDGAYHQGTVWPWLMGPFISAYVKAHDRSAAARAQAAGWLEPFRTHMLEAGLGQISEIFDGDPPHAPRGCIAQAWSVAELLRAAVEDL
jgi:predicted glycogen debranching enzyme